MHDRKMMTRVAMVVIAVPLAILLFNALGTALCDVWHYKAARFLEGGGSIRTEKLKAYWATRHFFLFLGCVAGLVVAHAAYLLWEGHREGKDA